MKNISARNRAPTATIILFSTLIIIKLPLVALLNKYSKFKSNSGVIISLRTLPNNFECALAQNYVFR